MTFIRKILHLLYAVIDVLGINAIFRYINRNKAIVLWYHGVCGDDFKLLKGYDERHVPLTLFREQLEYLKRKGYQFVTMSHLHDCLANNKKIYKLVVLTFDDGFSNIVENAYPAMNRVNARGTFYLVTDLIGSNELLWTDFVETTVRTSQSRELKFKFTNREISYDLNSRQSREFAMRDIKKRLRSIPDSERKRHLLQFDSIPQTAVPDDFRFSDWNQIKSLDSESLEIGSHTVNHPNLTALKTEDEYKTEILDSKNIIEYNTKQQIDHFCYPAGAYNSRVAEYVRKSGYKTAVTTKPGFSQNGDDPFEIRRVVVTESFPAFKAYVSGFYIFLRSIIKGGKG
jgi:peptidoglycan/xylan/chitin deacetylase (PgdA/CDA1 family)